jgi:putative endonuclease
VTNNLIKRICEHKHDVVQGFSSKHQLHRLVYFEQTSSIEAALRREKQMKKWNRQWKINLIEKSNPAWEDLYQKII